jgi:hypothetical protein
VFVVASAASTLDEEIDKLDDDARLVEMAALVTVRALSTLDDDSET